MIKKLSLGLIAIIVFFIVAVIMSFQTDLNQTYTLKSIEIDQDVEIASLELGQRIYEVRAGCIDCHGENLSGKLVMDNGAMGKIVGANITPYNLKNWSNSEIANAIRYGLHKSGRSLRFMPSFDYEGYSKGDVAAIIKYLRSKPEVALDNHPNTFGPIAKLTSFLGKMPVMFPAKVIDHSKDFAEKPEEAATLEFGKYLANACIGCHGAEFKGGPIPGGDPNWPEASNIRLGSNSIWTKDIFTQMIKTGVSPTTKEKMRPPMPIWLLEKYNDQEIDALWMYLSSLK